MTRAGYTLLEMLLVIALLGTLAALVVPGMATRTAHGDRTRALADMHAIAERLELYRLDGGRYPTTAQGLVALVERPTTPPEPRHWNPNGYLDAVPTDPWGSPYVYAATDAHGFWLRSLGADGTAGGAGAGADLELERP